ncbi:hypothetical protein F5Y13DRAFT_82595 [Hypoxylon sp. FL1857]|nr:hypothetical protein F5Y13DRAFT_82595 [Hypoxylon sp. FL1857]
MYRIRQYSMPRSPDSSRPRSRERDARNPMEREPGQPPSVVPQPAGNSVRVESQTRQFHSIRTEPTAAERSSRARRRS